MAVEVTLGRTCLAVAIDEVLDAVKPTAERAGASFMDARLGSL
jgi:hypothetical protein